MKKLTTIFLLFLFAFALQGQKVITYQGDVSLMDAGKGQFLPANGTESWSAVYGTNTIENDNGALKITYVDSQFGARVKFRESSDINTNLTIGKKYKVRAKAKNNTGGNNLRIFEGVVYPSFPSLSTEFTWGEVIFTATSTTDNALYCQYMSAGEIIWIDEWSIQEWYPDGRVIMNDGKVITYTASSSWVSPTGKEDDQWTDAANIYDGNIATSGKESTNGHSVTLTRASVSCSKIRINAGKVAGGQADLLIEVYYGGAFHQIHDGLLTEDTWQEINIGSTQNVTKARIATGDGINTEVWEFEFESL